MSLARGTTGVVRFWPNEEKITVEIDPELVALTRALLPPALRTALRPQKYAPHITLVRDEPLPATSWQLSARALILLPPDGKHVRVWYDPDPVVGEVYTWLRVFSPTLRRYRTRLGLPPSSPLTRPPDGEDCFHITLGNRKT